MANYNLQKILSFFFSRSPSPEIPEAEHSSLPALSLGKPRWGRIAGAVGVLLLLFSLILPKSGPVSPPPPRIDEQIFPTGPAGLADSSAEADQAQALLEQRRRELAEQTSNQVRLDRENIEIEEAPEDHKIGTNAPNPLADTPFVTVGGAMTTAKTLHQTSTGDILIATTSGITLAAKGNLSALTPRLEASSYEAQFGADLPALSSLFLQSNGDLWAGTEKGEVLRYHNFQWAVLAPAGDPIKGKISSFFEISGRVLIGSRGLWRWDDNFQRLIGNDSLRENFIATIVRGNKSLLAGGAGGIWELDLEAKEWIKRWESLKGDASVFALLPRPDGSLLAGTYNGYVEISPRWVVESRGLPGVHIRSIALDKDSGIWLATKNKGLTYITDGEWYSSIEEHAAQKNEQQTSLTSTDEGTKQQQMAKGLLSVDQVLIDESDQLWLITPDHGLLTARRNDVIAWMQNKKTVENAPIAKDEPQIFASVCEAAEKVLAGVNVSLNIAVSNLDGRQYVFFDGKQVCPKGLGVRRRDGKVLLKDGWNLTLIGDGGREEKQIPQEIPADRAISIYLDSNNRIWLGTGADGIFSLLGDKWENFKDNQGFERNSVRDFFEDENGGIWIASAPGYDNDKKKIMGLPLHVFADGQWFHKQLPRRLGQWAAFRVTALQNKSILVATDGGLSLLHKNGESLSLGKKDDIKPYYSANVALDGEGSIWIAHHFYGDGISWYDGQAIFSVKRENGLFEDRIANVAHDKQGRVWLVSTNGKVAVYPRSLLVEKATSVLLPKFKQLSLQAPPKKLAAR